MQFLDRFIKEICCLPYLYESQEFQTFLRPNGELEKALDALPKMTTDELLARFRQVMPVNEVQHTINKLNRWQVNLKSSNTTKASMNS